MLGVFLARQTSVPILYLAQPSLSSASFLFSFSLPLLLLPCFVWLLCSHSLLLAPIVFGSRICRRRRQSCVLVRRDKMGNCKERKCHRSCPLQTVPPPLAHDNRLQNAAFFSVRPLADQFPVARRQYSAPKFGSSVSHRISRSVKKA